MTARTRFTATASGIAAVLCVAAAWATGCAEATPEERLRAMLREAEVAVETGELARVRELVADDYLDEAGRDKRAALGLLALRRAGSDSVHLWTSLRSLELDPPEGARVRLLVAAAGTPIDGPDDLFTLDADLLWVDLVCRDDRKAGWQVTSAAWRPAGREELGG